MAEAGIDDIIIATNSLGAARSGRLCRLATPAIFEMLYR